MKHFRLLLAVATVLGAMTLAGTPAIAQEEEIPGATIGDQIEAHPTICHALAGETEVFAC